MITHSAWWQLSRGFGKAQSALTAIRCWWFSAKVGVMEVQTIVVRNVFHNGPQRSFI